MLAAPQAVTAKAQLGFSKQDLLAVASNDIRQPAEPASVRGPKLADQLSDGTNRFNADRFNVEQDQSASPQLCAVGPICPGRDDLSGDSDADRNRFSVRLHKVFVLACADRSILPSFTRSERVRLAIADHAAGGRPSPRKQWNVVVTPSDRRYAGLHRSRVTDASVRSSAGASKPAWIIPPCPGSQISLAQRPLQSYRRYIGDVGEVVGWPSSEL